MKIFTSKQIHDLDAYTIEHEPIASIDLMERAAHALTSEIMSRIDSSSPLVVFAGPGNNGGDGLAVARLLSDAGYNVSAYLFNVTGRLSEECQTNRARLRDSRSIKRFIEVKDEFDPPELSPETIVIDALFGSGLNKPLGGGFASLVRYMNSSRSMVISIDLPSGLMSEDNSYNIITNIVRADLTLTLQTKKLCMYLADCQQYLGEVRVLDIGLSEEWQAETKTHISLLEHDNVVSLLRARSDFAHKGTMGHALIIAGCYGMAGAATLAARACLRGGAGKVTAHIPQRNYDIMQISVPEAIVHIDTNELCFSESVDDEAYDAVAIGPGLGQRDTTAAALISQIKRTRKPLILDADALNILGTHKSWLQQIPQGTLLTPHPKEFDRVDGSAGIGDYDRLAKAREMAQRMQAYIMLKGHHTALCQPDGSVLLNSTGNGGMATAGSGDVLTGLVAALVSRGYSVPAAAVVGMYLHGMAGDIAATRMGRESLMATDIIEAIPEAFRKCGVE